MKKQTKIGGLFTLVMALFFNCIAGGLMASAGGYDPMAGAMAVNGVATGIPFAARVYAHYNGISLSYDGTYLYAGVIKEVFTDIIMEKFFVPGTFIEKAVDMSSFSDNGVINLADAGIYPNVLLNNTTFPIPMGQRTDTPIALAMNTLSTESSFVTNIEKLQSAYDKMSSVTRQHQLALQQYAFDNAAYNYTPTSDSAFTPVIATTGPDNGFGFKSLTFKDVAALKVRFDKAKAPQQGRWLVLTPQHQADLLAADTQLFKSMANLADGQVLTLFGFQILSYPTTAVFNKTSGVKAAYGAAAAPSTDTISSFAFCESEVMKAMANIDMFIQYDAPSVQGDIFNFQMRFMALPIRNKAIGALYSPAA